MEQEHPRSSHLVADALNPFLSTVVPLTNAPLTQHRESFPDTRM
jgi:hypothetical protein